MKKLQFLGLILGSLIVVFGFNLFLIPHQVLSSGLSGISMMIGMISPINTGLANFLLNFPLLIIGYKMLGKKFIMNSIFSVFIISVGLYLVPVHEIAKDTILSSIFGGALTGIGVGIVFRSSGSTGGFDIIGMIVSRKRDFPIGTLLSGMNAVVIVISGFLFNWDSALNTLVSIYVTGKVVDAIYTDHAKLTLMIITEKGQEMREHLLTNLYRGLTIMDGVGGYSNNQRNVLITVISRYELNEVKNLITEVDPAAFVNITETIEVMGLFHRPSPS
ncbi:YitT family protein [Neobacillus sp. MM2021_6]|uniref:YitT family protein n=1 Tax=Bacillaceae TaxID=186817 RepID=UPI00140A7E0B|nr:MULTISPECIES: YitT family protein [Bacillaceae]MBO0962073.1 YitT family protein [Neobacillus sp. MM2021_6]NHC19980.1 YitT family protein [Bacillus sp. MM2020_4]WML40096.1 YitT family protein [Neobacillus sp. OS1-2]